MKMKYNAGFTIIELMIAIVIGGILLAIAIPNFTDMAKNNCLTTKTNALVGALQAARSAAITRRADIRAAALCQVDVDNNGVADSACSGTNEFGAGIVVFEDIDGDGLADTTVEDTNGNGTLDAGEDTNGNGVLDAEIIRTFAFSCPATVNETTSGTDTVDNSLVFIYTPNGAVLPRATFNVCDDRASADYKGRQITLSVTGRPSTNSSFTCP